MMFQNTHQEEIDVVDMKVGIILNICDILTNDGQQGCAQDQDDCLESISIDNCS